MALRRGWRILATANVAFVACSCADARPNPIALTSPTITASSVPSPSRTLTRVPSSRMTKTVYLTFDDGPNPAWTPEILSLLEESGAQASFFVIG